MNFGNIFLKLLPNTAHSLANTFSQGTTHIQLSNYAVNVSTSHRRMCCWRLGGIRLQQLLSNFPLVLGVATYFCTL